MAKRRKISKRRRNLFLIFGIYVIVMLYLLLFMRTGITFSGTYGEYISSAVNLIPFKTIVDYASEAVGERTLTGWAMKNLSGNILLFVPLGFFLPTLWKKQRRFKNFAITVCLSILSVEAFQLFTMLGRFDIDDLIFNLAGAAIGFGIWKMKPVISLLKKYKLL